MTWNLGGEKEVFSGKGRGVERGSGGGKERRTGRGQQRWERQRKSAS